MDLRKMVCGPASVNGLQYKKQKPTEFTVEFSGAEGEVFSTDNMRNIRSGGKEHSSH
jgi:hypothetical protein